MTTKIQWFDEHGNYIGRLPDECVADCSGSGSVDESVEYWVRKLDFDVPEPQAFQWLKDYGAWDDDERRDHDANVRRVLWLACCDIKETGEWFGLVH